MKRNITYIILGALLITGAPAVSQEYREVENVAFQPGEMLKYQVYYDMFLSGKMVAGYATTEVMKETIKYNNRDCYHIIGKGWTVAPYDWAFKVRDRFETYMDKEALMTHYFKRKTREGKHRGDDAIYFDQKNNTAKSSLKTKKTTPYVQDVVSAIYYTRNLKADTLEEGDMVYVDFFLDDSLYVSAIQFQGRETVETELGIFDCLKLSPMMATGNIFADQYPMTMWVTDDDKHIPVLIKSKVVVGSVTVELVKTHNTSIKN